MWSLRVNGSAAMEIVRSWRSFHPNQSSARGVDIEILESPELSLLSKSGEYLAAVLVDTV